MNALVQKAEAYATEKHSGQVRKFGNMPYIEHLRRIAAKLATLTYPDFVVAAAWLHDVVEDTGTDFHDLEVAGFPQDVVKTVFTLTRGPSESYALYIKRIKSEGSFYAQAIKKLDLEDNMSDLHPGSLLDKYELAYMYLSV